LPGNHATPLRRQVQGCAIPEFDKAVEPAPGEPILHIALGNSLQKLGRIDQTRREFETCLEMAPSAPPVEALGAVAALTDPTGSRTITAR
jgi:Flp pilus assembly protein TadD